MLPLRNQHPPLSSVVQSTELPSLSTERHLVFPLKASFALHKGESCAVYSRFFAIALNDKKKGEKKLTTQNSKLITPKTMNKKELWQKIIHFVITILTAIATTLGTTSCIGMMN